MPKWMAFTRCGRCFEHVEVFRPVEKPRVLWQLRKEHLPGHQVALPLGLTGHGSSTVAYCTRASPGCTAIAMK